MKTKKKFLNINIPAELHTEIEKYRNANAITSFSAAIFELIRSGLAAGSKASRKTFNPGTEIKPVPMSVPLPLFIEIEKYQANQYLSTRTNAIIELLRIGLSQI